MDLAGTVQAHNHVITVTHKLGGVTPQEETRTENGDPDIGLAQQLTQLPQVRVKERFATAQHDAFHAEGPPLRQPSRHLP